MKTCMRYPLTTVIASAFLLAGCNGVGLSGGGADGKFRAKAKDNVRCKASQSTCYIDVDYEDPKDATLNCGDYCFAIAPAFAIIDPPSMGGPRYVEWNLPAKVHFLPNGIAFDQSAPFKNCATGKAPPSVGNDKSFHCTNTGTETGVPWKYTINLELDNKKDGTIQATDPWVVNK